jgi:ribosomal protein S18 acetylase RimI-like enzyme
MTTIEARRAGRADAQELTRLRGVMFRDMGRDPLLLDETWQQRNTEYFRARLAETDDFAAFVVDRPAAGLAAAAVGWLERRLIGTANPTGRIGYIANVSTDPDERHRGHARRTMTELVAWFRTTGISMVTLNAAPDGDRLYRSLGFIEPEDPELVLRL